MGEVRGFGTRLLSGCLRGLILLPAGLEAGAVRCLMVQCRCLTRAFTFFPPPPHLQKTSVQGLRSIEVVVRGSAVACCVWLAGVVRVG